MASTETAIHWYEARRGKVGFSIADRMGNKTFDTSSALYTALIAGELLPADTEIGNTNNLFTDLEANSWTRTDSPRRGDVFLMGAVGYASGEAGIAGMFISDTNVILCSRSQSGIGVSTISEIRSAEGNPPVRYYHTSSNDSSTPTTLNNFGELEFLGIAENEVIAEGWHFSSFRPIQYIDFMNAETGQRIARVTPQQINRPDLAEEYPNVDGIENSGFRATLKVEDRTSVYIKGVRCDGTICDELVFQGIIIYEQAFNVELDRYPANNKSIWYEVLDKSGKTVVRGDELFGELTWTVELMSIPNIDISIPIRYNEYIHGREEMRIYGNFKVFDGIVTDIELDKENEIMNLTLSHIVSEWEYRQVSTNLACKNRTIADIYSTLDFRYDGWNMDFLQNSARERIDYVYSRQNKLSALTKTCELTDDVYWRVGNQYGKLIEVGSFGERKPYTITPNPPSENNIQIISHPEIKHELGDVYNIATVYGEKSDSGMSSLSLRDMYEDEDAWVSGFPIRILRNGINNERGYDYVEFSKLAPNNDIEYTVIDEYSVALENDTVIESTYSFNDINPFQIDGEEITDEDRALAAKMAYHTVIKILKQRRRRYIISCMVSEVPETVNVGDMLHFVYNNSEFVLDSCNDFERKILTEDEYFYLTSITRTIGLEGTETAEITLEKSLHTNRTYTGR